MSWKFSDFSLNPYEGKYRSTCSWHLKCSMRQNLPFSGGPVPTASIWNSDATSSHLKPPATGKLQRRMNTSSKKVYNQHWSSFSKFMTKALKRQALPAKSDDIYLYVTHLHSLHLKASTICNHLSAIAFAHKINYHQDPTEETLQAFRCAEVHPFSFSW